MRTINYLIAILFSIVVTSCGGGSDYGGGNSGGSTPSIYTISGTISGGASGNGGVVINLTGAATKNVTTTAGGSYSFTGLANGVYTVAPTLVGYGFAPSSAAVTVNFNNPSNINFTEAP